MSSANTTFGSKTSAVQFCSEECPTNDFLDIYNWLSSCVRMLGAHVRGGFTVLLQTGRQALVH